MTIDVDLETIKKIVEMNRVILNLNAFIVQTMAGEGTKKFTWKSAPEETGETK